MICDALHAKGCLLARCWQRRVRRLYVVGSNVVDTAPVPGTKREIPAILRALFVLVLLYLFLEVAPNMAAEKLPF